MADENYQMTVKIVLIGDSGVGKTNIMSKFLRNEFNEKSKATIGVEFGSKTFTLGENKVQAQIWDTAGQEKYRAIANAYYRGAKGAIVVYDLTRKATFNSTDKWISDLKASGDKRMQFILVGNKCDLEENREVLREQGEEKAKAFKCAFMETSASSGHNIENAFQSLMDVIYKTFGNDLSGENEDNEVNGGEDIKLEKVENVENKKCCAGS